MPDTPHAPPPPTGLPRLIDALARLSVGIAAVSLLGLVAVQGWQVFARYVLNDSPSWTEPVTVLLLSIAMSLGAAAGVHGNRHFGFYLLHDHLHPHVRRAVDVLVPLVVAGIGAVLAGWGAVLLADGFAIHAAGAALPQSINYLPLSLGGALMVLFALERAVAALRRPAGEAG
ncbi:TRAP transporter small permease [Stenotrophomonas sp. MMGLT7]|uniref:TRAP transporter small permease n=1 Tax=Stenotrophomonas sp. MMGLT7 TaxID=2901227 RepID=UPI001E3188A6|nr:TRAP transporter small permease [Stenotrophomonas sp. MMGLT7]MCD7098554.1 TRAP transporter small permease [Stenotrophomonas sp. MMGLT7]